MRRLLALTLLMALVPTWLSASGCMVCPHMLGLGGGAGHAEHGEWHQTQPHSQMDHGGQGSNQQPRPAPSSPADNCPCDSFCSVAPVVLEVGAAERATAEELSKPILYRPEPEALLTPERPPFFLPLSNAPPARG